MKTRLLFKNIISGFVGQFFVIILGILIPRIMIKTYGSDINGLVATSAQIFSYLALLEAGIGQSARIALYKPISENDKNVISNVFITAEAYYRKVTLLYLWGVILLSLISPLIIKSEESFFVIMFVFLFEGLSGVLSFYFIQTPTILLYADGKGYINNIINLVIQILCYSFKIILASIGINIVFIQIIFFLITIIKVTFYSFYLKKKYSWIVKGNKPDYSLLKDKNSYLITEIGWTIFSSTDIIVLSIFLSTKLSSVYSIYNLIYNNIYLLMNAATGSVLYILGQVYHRNIKEYEDIHDSLNTIIIGITTILMSVCYILTIPFIKLYIKDVADVEYIYYQLPFLFSMVQMLSWSRYVNGNLTALGGYAKSTSWISLVEALINLILSVALVNKFGIVGVLIATVIALPVKVLWCVYISDKKILHRSFKNTIIIYGSNFLLFFAIIYFSRYLNIEICSYGMFIIYGIIIFTIVSVLGVLLNLTVNKRVLIVFKKYILNK